MGKGPEQIVFKRRNASDKQIYGKSSISLAIREIEIKTVMRYRLTSIRMVITKKKATTASKVVKTVKLFYPVGGKVN